MSTQLWINPTKNAEAKTKSSLGSKTKSSKCMFCSFSKNCTTNATFEFQRNPAKISPHSNLVHSKKNRMTSCAHAHNNLKAGKCMTSQHPGLLLIRNTKSSNPIWKSAWSRMNFVDLSPVGLFSRRHKFPSA